MFSAQLNFRSIFMVKPDEISGRLIETDFPPVQKNKS
jgi:hypothetical protein